MKRDGTEKEVLPTYSYEQVVFLMNQHGFTEVESERTLKSGVIVYVFRNPKRATTVHALKRVDGTFNSANLIYALVESIKIDTASYEERRGASDLAHKISSLLFTKPPIPDYTSNTNIDLCGVYFQINYDKETIAAHGLNNINMSKIRNLLHFTEDIDLIESIPNLKLSSKQFRRAVKLLNDVGQPATSGGSK